MSISTLAKAPLIETVFELRWKVSADDFAAESVQLSESQKALFQKFEELASSVGYTVKESVNDPLPFFPYLPKIRLRQAEDSWPLFQIGVGILTVNQINDGYKWESFQSAILDGIKLLTDGHPAGFDTRLLGMELRYIDGFPLQDSESLANATEPRFTFRITESLELISHSSIRPQLTDVNLAYQYELIDPPGVLEIELVQGKINGENSLVMHIIVRTAGESAADLSTSPDAVLEWTKEARTIQQHAFRSLITTDFFRTFE